MPRNKSPRYYVDTNRNGFSQYTLLQHSFPLKIIITLFPYMCVCVCLFPKHHFNGYIFQKSLFQVNFETIVFPKLIIQ